MKRTKFDYGDDIGKPKTPTSFRIYPEINNRLDALAEEYNLTRTAMLEIAIRERLFKSQLESLFNLIEEMMMEIEGIIKTAGKKLNDEELNKLWLVNDMLSLLRDRRFYPRKPGTDRPTKKAVEAIRKDREKQDV